MHEPLTKVYVEFLQVKQLLDNSPLHVPHVESQVKQEPLSNVSDTFLQVRQLFDAIPLQVLHLVEHETHAPALII
jgi:hypothetical protein